MTPLERRLQRAPVVGAFTPQSKVNDPLYYVNDEQRKPVTK